jgi:pimeloyl-ACP methyl ester carboxylesterase
MSAEECEERRGPTLVCLHGLSGSSRWWSQVVPRVERAGPVVLLDVPRALEPLRLPEWVIEQLEGLEPPVDVAGHSFGGLVAARVAASRPDLVRRLVLIAPPGMRPRSSMVPYLWPLAVTVARSRPALIRRLTADALRAGPRNLVRGGRHVSTADVRTDLDSVVAPTLLVWGARDTIVPPGEGRDWCEALADARLVVLPRAGHVPMIDAADELADVIVAFREKPLDELGDLPGV